MKGRPDFIGLGTIKSGTTWLHRCIEDHPDSFTPSLKEIHYFDENYSRGENWYLSFFRGANGRPTGEFSPRYITVSDVLQRLGNMPDDVKFIVSFRNPVDRAYSHFQMDMRDVPNMSELDKVEEFDRIATNVDSEYVRFGVYSDQLRPYLEKFSIDRFHFVIFEDIQSDPLAVISKLYGFLGLREDFVPNSIRNRVNESKRYKNVRIFRFLQKIVRLSEAVGLLRFIEWLKVRGVRDKVLDLIERTESYLPMLPSTRAKLVRYYEPSITSLEMLIDKDLSHWRR